MDAKTISKFFHTSGWLGKDEADLLYDKAVECGGNIIEIGSHLGKSSVVLGAGAVKNNALLYCIDPWTVWATPKELGELAQYMRPPLSIDKMEMSSLEIFKENVAHLNNVVIIQGLSYEIMPSELVPKEVAMVFVDGDHSYESVKRDLELALAKNPIFIACHDYMTNDHEGVTDACLEIFGRGANQSAGTTGVWRLR